MSVRPVYRQVMILFMYTVYYSIHQAYNEKRLFFFFCQTLFLKMLFELVRFIHASEVKYQIQNSSKRITEFLVYERTFSRLVTHNSLSVFAAMKVIIFNCLYCSSSSVIMSWSMFWLRSNLGNKIYSLCLFVIPDPSINKGKWKQ